MFHAKRPYEAAEPHDPLLLNLPTPDSVSTSLRLSRLSKRFSGHAAVDGLSLEVPSGSIYGVIGKSGAGKSTLLRMAALLEPPDSGEVFHGGASVAALRGQELRAARRRVGVVFQSFNLFASRTAAGNVAFPLEAAGVEREAARARVALLLSLVGLPDKATRPVSRLSGGERQRVAIARALALEPAILFCDEATSALDPETTRSVLDLIAELQAGLGLTVVMVTHQMEVVRRVCDRVAILEGGRLAESGLVSEVFHQPRSEVGRRLVAEVARG